MPGWSCGTGQVAGARPGANPGSGRLDRTSHLWDTSPSPPPPTQQCCWSVPGKCQGGGARGREAPVWERQISDPPNPALQPMLSTAGACPQAAQESFLCVSRSESPESDTGTRVHRGHGEQGSHMTRLPFPGLSNSTPTWDTRSAPYFLPGQRSLQLMLSWGHLSTLLPWGTAFRASKTSVGLGQWQPLLRGSGKEAALQSGLNQSWGAG